MKYMWSFLIPFLLCGSSSAQTQLPSIELPPGLDRVLRDYEKGWQGGDASGLAELFTEDGFVMSSNRPPVRGREAIEKRYAGARGSLNLRAMAYEISGATGYIIGGFSYDPENGDSGKFILALRKSESGRWLIAADIDNSNSR